MKSAVRQIEMALAAGSEDEAKSALQRAIPIIDKTASKGTIHKRTAARKISRLTKRVNKMQPLG